LSPEGNEFVFKALRDLIRKEYPEISITNTKGGGTVCKRLPKYFPWHSEIDYKDPASAFQDK